ncbi:hypothetical protein M8J76_001512 [Diaphorina citri]|nr:hypothetical protein M8J76_001512 [Diaphorina citri]
MKISPSVVQLSTTILCVTIMFAMSTKIIDYDNVADNPYYRKSNLEMMIRGLCNFLQVKTTPEPTTRKPSFIERMKDALERKGVSVKSKDELSDNLVNGLVTLVNIFNPHHELASRNLTDDERFYLKKAIPEMMHKIDEEPDYTDLYK